MAIIPWTPVLLGEGLLAIDINQTQASQSMKPILRAIISICMFQQSLNDSEHYNQSGVSISTNVLKVYMLQEVNRHNYNSYVVITWLRQHNWNRRNYNSHDLS